LVARRDWLRKCFSLLVLAKDALVAIPIFSMVVLSTIGFFNSCYCASRYIYLFGGAFVELRPVHSCIWTCAYTWPPSSLIQPLKQVGYSKNIYRKVRPSGQPGYQESSLIPLRNEFSFFSSTNTNTTTTTAASNSTHVSTICSNRHADTPPNHYHRPDIGQSALL
jgi:hypothetical protein